MDEPLAAPRSLRTRRLLLRAWDPADAPLLRAELDASDAHLRPWVPFLKGEPRTVEATRDRLAAFRDAFASGRQLVYGIFTADASRVLGEAMLFGDPPVRELGFWTAVDVGRQGFAREATQALLDLARGLLPTTAVHLRCAPDNLASAALAERLGFMTGTVLGFMGLTWEFRAAVQIGDTIHVTASVEELKPMPRLGGGYVTFKLQVLNQANKVVQRGTWKVLIKSQEE